MKKLKVMTIVGTRPEIIRLSEVIKACDRCFSHSLVHTGQNWDDRLGSIFFEELGLRLPDHQLHCATNSGSTQQPNLGQTIGMVIAESYTLMQQEQPDALLILGDTNSALSSISAKRLKIPIFHMEAGNRCFDTNVPEEVNRKIVDHIADVNLPYTAHSQRNLQAEGIGDRYVFVTGSPMREVMQAHHAHINQSEILENLNLQKQQYFLVSAHREENIDSAEQFFSLMNALNHIAEQHQLPIIYSVHPRSKKYIQARDFSFHPLIRQIAPFGFFDYNQLQQNAYCVLSDSGTLAEETAILKFPAVLLRTSTERPEAIDAGKMVIGGVSYTQIEQAIELAVQATQQNMCTNNVSDYQDANVSQKVVQIIQSYTKLVLQKN